MIDQLVPHWWAIAAAIYAWAAACFWAVMEPDVERRWAVAAIAITWPISTPFLVWWRDREVKRANRRNMDALKRAIAESGITEEAQRILFPEGTDNGKAD